MVWLVLGWVSKNKNGMVSVRVGIGMVSVRVGNGMVSVRVGIGMVSVVGNGMVSVGWVMVWLALGYGFLYPGVSSS